MKKCVVAILTVLISLNLAFAARASEPDPFDYARAVYEYVTGQYYGEIDESVLAENLIRAIMESLDGYSRYMTPEELKQFLDGLSGNFEGIGITFESTVSGYTILSVLRGGPARLSGLLPGDVIIFVDGRDVRLLDSETVASLIRGKAGETVVLSVKREGWPEILEYSIVRGIVEAESVEFRLIDKSTGYIKITAFQNSTYDQLDAAVSFFVKRGIKKLVLDLRNNGGGYVSQAVLSAGIFAGEGLITTLDFADATVPDITYVSEKQAYNGEVTVLVNRNTASAAELFTAALSEKGACVVIGEKTFGKGVFQTGSYIISYETYMAGYSGTTVKTSSNDGSGYLHLTSGVYLTPLGNNIDKTGIIPDIEITDTQTALRLASVDRVSQYYGYAPGSAELIQRNASQILILAGYLADGPGLPGQEEFRNAIAEFQSDNSLVPDGTLNYITCRMLDIKLVEFSARLDASFAEALKQLD